MQPRASSAGGHRDRRPSRPCPSPLFTHPKYPPSTLLDNLGDQDYSSLDGPIERLGEHPFLEKILEQQLELLQGTLDLLILKAVSLSPLHGYGVLLRIQQISGQTLTIQQGSLYPALYRLEHQGAIASDWGESENNRRAKFYRLTDLGRSRLEDETAKWNRMAGIMGVILNTPPILATEKA
jgi:PadR family transcriptional regulator